MASGSEPENFFRSTPPNPLWNNHFNLIWPPYTKLAENKIKEPVSFKNAFSDYLEHNTVKK